MIHEERIISFREAASRARRQQESGARMPSAGPLEAALPWRAPEKSQISAKVFTGSSDIAANMMAGRKDRKHLQPSNNNIQFGAGSKLKGETK